MTDLTFLPGGSLWTLNSLFALRAGASYIPLNSLRPLLADGSLFACRTADTLFSAFAFRSCRASWPRIPFRSCRTPVSFRSYRSGVALNSLKSYNSGSPLGACVSTHSLRPSRTGRPGGSSGAYRSRTSLIAFGTALPHWSLFAAGLLFSSRPLWSFGTC